MPKDNCMGETRAVQDTDTPLFWWRKEEMELFQDVGYGTKGHISPRLLASNMASSAGPGLELALAARCQKSEVFSPVWPASVPESLS